MGTYIRKVGSNCLDGYLYLWGTCIRWVLILPRIRYVNMEVGHIHMLVVLSCVDSDDSSQGHVPHPLQNHHIVKLAIMQEDMYRKLNKHENQ